MGKIRFCTLYSGSSANSAYIEINGRGILIDAGASMKRTEAALNNLGKSLSNIEAVFVTHEHSDHIAGLPMLAKYYHIPIIANQKTLNKILLIHHNIDKGLIRVMPTGATAHRDEFSVTSFESSHDGVETVGYTVTYNGTKIGVLTDSGQVTDEMNDSLRGSKALLLESNHDIEMLRNGPYPYSLQQRILSQNGHLSNAQCGKTLCELVKNGTEYVILGHLSSENNTPQTALETVCRCLKNEDIFVGRDVFVEVAPRYEASGVIELAGN